MAQLSPQQLQFLERQGIPLSRVFDATGLAKATYHDRMKALDMLVATGVSPCSAGGHTLRTRHGHCIQCGTHNLAFLRRFDERGFVYVARSEQTNLVKVGTSADVGSRQQSLCRIGYGGASDWRVQYHEVCAKAGRAEFSAHQRLASSRVSCSYVREGSPVDCQELFRCPAGDAVRAVQAAVLEVSRGQR